MRSVNVEMHIVHLEPFYDDEDPDDFPQLLFVVHAAGDPHNEIGRLGGTPAQIYDALEQISEAMAVFQGSP